MTTGNAILTLGGGWPEVRRQLEALIQIGIYYSDLHDKNFRLR